MIRSTHSSFRDWIYHCLNDIPNPKTMDLDAWGAVLGQKLLAPTLDESGNILEAFRKEMKFNNLIPATLKRFLSWGFIFFDPA